jgi:hypothetical protein
VWGGGRRCRWVGGGVGGDCCRVTVHQIPRAARQERRGLGDASRQQHAPIALYVIKRRTHATATAERNRMLLGLFASPAMQLFVNLIPRHTRTCPRWLRGVHRPLPRTRAKLACGIPWPSPPSTWIRPLPLQIPAIAAKFQLPLQIMRALSSPGACTEIGIKSSPRSQSPPSPSTLLAKAAASRRAHPGS